MGKASHGDVQVLLIQHAYSHFCNHWMNNCVEPCKTYSGGMGNTILYSISLFKLFIFVPRQVLRIYELKYLLLKYSASQENAHDCISIFEQNAPKEQPMSAVTIAVFPM